MKKYYCVNKTSGKKNIKQDNFLWIDTEKQKHAGYFLKIYRHKCSQLLERMIRRGTILSNPGRRLERTSLWGAGGRGWGKWDSGKESKRI